MNLKKQNNFIKKSAVEYQGSQHFKPIDFFGGKERFKYQVERDMNKIKLCEENGIKLFHFTYDKNIPSNFNLYFIYKNEKKLIDDIKKNDWIILISNHFIY